MLDSTILKQLAVKHQTSELNIRREYIQHVFLSRFYQQKESENIYFKGGTALRIIYGSPRFSEDLDFSGVSANLKKIEKALQEALIQIEYFGINCEIVESKTTSGGYLAILQFNFYNQKTTIQIEVSHRDSKTKGTATTIINDFVPAYTLVMLDRDLLIKQKINALLQRKKPRDFYDMYFILRAGLLPVKERKILEEVFLLLRKTNISFERELGLFLPVNQHRQISNFAEVLESEIRRLVVIK